MAQKSRKFMANKSCCSSSPVGSAKLKTRTKMLAKRKRNDEAVAEEDGDSRFLLKNVEKFDFCTASTSRSQPVKDNSTISADNFSFDEPRILSDLAKAKLAALSRTRKKIPEGPAFVSECTPEQEELKQYIQQFLPEEFEHLFVSVKKLAPKNFSKWEAKLKVSVKTKEEMKEWLRIFEDRTKTKWIVGRNYRPSLTYRKDMICQHNDRNKSTLNWTRNRSRSIACNSAKLILKIKNQSFWAKYRNPILETHPAEISIIYDHSHAMGSKESLEFLRAGDDVRQQFLEYFRAGMGPVESLHNHKNKLLESVSVEQPELIDQLLVDASIVPRSRTVYYWHKLWKEEHKPLSSEKMTEILSDRLPFWRQKGYSIEAEVFRLKTKSKIVTPGSYIDSEEILAIAILSPLMKRALENLAMCEEVVYVDSSGENYVVTMLQTASNAGVVPIGMLITYGDPLVAYEKGFGLLKNLIDESFGENAFLGQKYPSTFLTSNDAGIRHGLTKTWPESEVKLISANAAQFVWSWVTDPGNNIDPQDYPAMIRGFMGMVRAVDTSSYNDSWSSALQLTTGYGNWEEFLDSCNAQREDWCWMDRNVETRQNRFVEATLGIYRNAVNACEKKCGISGTLSLMEALLERIEALYEERLLSYSDSGQLLVKTEFPPLTHAGEWQIQMIDDDLFVVWTDVEPCFVISSTANCSFCTWFPDIDTVYCSHLTAVFGAFPDSEWPASTFDPMDSSVEEVLRTEEPIVIGYDQGAAFSIEDSDLNQENLKEACKSSRKIDQNVGKFDGISGKNAEIVPIKGNKLVHRVVSNEEVVSTKKLTNCSPGKRKNSDHLSKNNEKLEEYEEPQERAKRLRAEFLRDFEKKLEEFGEGSEGVEKLEKLTEKMNGQGVGEILDGVLKG